MRTFGIAVVIAGAIFASAADAQVASTCNPWPSPYGWQCEGHPVAWQQGNARPRPWFAPPGCYAMRWVTTPHSASWQSVYICR